MHWGAGVHCWKTGLAAGGLVSHLAISASNFFMRGLARSDLLMNAEHILDGPQLAAVVTCMEVAGSLPGVLKFKSCFQVENLS